MNPTTRISILSFIFFLGGCSLAPTYHRPTMDIPSSYKETGHWLQAKPKGDINRGAWWEMYHDSTLNQLEEQVSLANQDIKAALARYEQAKAVTGVARSALYPNILGVANANRLKASKTIANPMTVTISNDVLLSASLTYEVDVWGRVRNLVHAASSVERASAADLASIKLSLHAELANDYFALRSADTSQRILDETVIAYQKALYLTRQRFKGGAVSVSDVDQAQTQLETAKTMAADMHLRRAQLEHAIAILIGKTPANFSLPPIKHLKFKQVTVNPYLPSTLLERRPDIASAEQLVQAANANIGVTRAAFFPDFNLTTGIGFESQSFGQLLQQPSLIWSLGPSALLTIFNTSSMPLVTQTIFDGGKIYNLNQQAWASYCETVANYQKTVLNAFQEVEDNLSAIRQLDIENKTQSVATQSANRALEQALFRYKGGLTTYLDVVVIQTIALQNELASVNIRTRRQVASVQLIKALGGGWEAKKLSIEEMKA